MSRKFNGTSSDKLSAACDLSAYAQASISFWLWNNANNASNKFACEYGNPNFDTAFTGAGFVLNDTTTLVLGVGKSSSSWLDNATVPTAAAWHHYVLTFNRATPVNTLYIDGVLQTLTTNAHTAATYGNFVNGTLYFMSRGTTTFFGVGRMAEVALWGGTIMTARQALAAYNGGPLRAGPFPTFYWPLYGDSPEPEYGGTRKSGTVVGGSVVAHPPVRGFFRRAA